MAKKQEGQQVENPAGAHHLASCNNRNILFASPSHRLQKKQNDDKKDRSFVLTKAQRN